MTPEMNPSLGQRDASALLEPEYAQKVGDDSRKRVLVDEQPIEKPESDKPVGIPAPSVHKATPAPSVPEAPPAPAMNVPPIPPKRPVPRVAVIGVHGVGYHAPGATANAMADLLLSLPAEDHDAPRFFRAFQSVGIQVPLQRLVVDPPAREAQAQTAFGRKFGFLQEESASFARTTRGYATGAPAGASRGFAGHEFMRRLLYRYQGGADGDAYVTTRLEGKRDAEALGGEAHVHIYEVLWADLARPTNSFLSFLLAFFQLILHLGSLSRLAIDTGAPRNSSGLWIAYRRTHRYAVRMLQIPIPLLKLILLIALYSCIPTMFPATRDQAWFPITIGALAGIIIYFLLIRGNRRAVPSSPMGWAINPVIAGIVGAAAAGVVVISCRPWCARVAALECWFSGVLLLWYVLSNYGDVRRGVGGIGWLFYGVFLLVFVAYLVTSSSVPKATLWTAEWIMVALRVSWIVLVLLAFLALMLGRVAWRSVQNPDDRAKARAAVRTSRFALAIPCLMFLLITSLLWASLFSLARKVQDPFFRADVLSLPPGGSWLPEFLVPNPLEPTERAGKSCSAGPDCTSARIQWSSGANTLNCDPKKDNCKPELAEIRFFDPPKRDYLEGALAWSVTPGFPVLLILAAAGFFLLVWWALPSVLTETFPLRDEDKPPRDSTNGECMRLGSWTSRGLDSISLVLFLIWCAIFVAPLYFLYLYPPPLLPELKMITGWIVGFFIAATVAAGILGAIVKYSSPVLGAVLDVDTYMRTSPANATPRAKIVERYVSLLRYLVRYRDPVDGGRYDSVVIVAHSLGTLISADLLRFLHAEGDSVLAPLGLAGEFLSNRVGDSLAPSGVAGETQQKQVSLKLLTMGSPIRQLLNRFFPYLYDWAQERPDSGLQPLPAPVVSPPPIEDNALPNPAELGLEKWVSMYRSGDYVGRSLWLTEWYRRTEGRDDVGAYPDPLYIARPRASSDPRSEMCIGTGAHTHYWDDTAPDVAEQLNALI